MEILGCCGGVFGVLVVLLVASTLLRAAVALVNRVLGPAAPPDTFGQWDDWDSDEPAPAVRKPSGRVVPEPGLATGMLVAFVAGLVNAVGYAVLAFVADAAFDDAGPPNELAAVVLLLLFGLPLSTAAHTVLLVPLLPTTFGRAGLVAAAYHLILVALAVVVGGLGLFVWYASGP